MRYQYKREPLTTDEATRLANPCDPHEEKLVVWTLLDLRFFPFREATPVRTYSCVTAS